MNKSKNNKNYILTNIKYQNFYILYNGIDEKNGIQLKSMFSYKDIKENGFNYSDYETIIYEELVNVCYDLLKSQLKLINNYLYSDDESDLVKIYNKLPKNIIDIFEQNTDELNNINLNTIINLKNNHDLMLYYLMDYTTYAKDILEMFFETEKYEKARELYLQRDEGKLESTLLEQIKLKKNLNASENNKDISSNIEVIDDEENNNLDEKRLHNDKMLKFFEGFSNTYDSEKEALNRKQELNQFNEYLRQNPPKENIIRFIEGNLDNKEVDILNNNSLLPVKFLSNDMLELQNQQINNLNFIKNYMSCDYRCDDFELKYSGYPTDEDEYKMNYLKLNTSKYHFVSIYAGVTTIEEADILLKKYGFTICNNQINFSNNNRMYENKNCKIEFSVKYNIVDWIKIELEADYLGNCMY